MHLSVVPHAPQCRPGDVLCDLAHPLPLVKRFRARMFTMNKLPHPLVRGLGGLSFHTQSIDEPAKLSRILHTLNKDDTIAVKKPK